ncbi:PREDICTED: uncharacterized protein LOC105314736 [Amphimedon queenslandica]|nr:PREDICTED: uncharacterized protein LOC105314736 [Amphimedon queenslandica]|eukprot:XP_011407389.2 PREDICTED: uncharacterized protein LOC105314736 [Amphimedon queenslandica]
MDHIAEDVGLGPSGLVGKANSIQHLLDYLKEEEQVDHDYFKLCKVSDKLKKIIKNCNKERKRLEREKRDMRLGEGVEYDDKVLEFLEGEKVEERLKEVLSHEVIDEEEAILLRRVAMCRLMYGNYQRSGTVKNIEMEEYRNRIKSEEHDVILVKNHKTKDRYGSAKVVCKKETVEVIEKYLEYAPESKYLFVTRTGHQVANPFRELENLCIQMGHQAIKISPTEHRKQSASRVELGRDEKMTLKISQMMDHSIDTHRAKYTFVNTAKEAIGAYKTLQDWRHSQHTKKEQKIEECEDREREVRRKRKWTMAETREIERVMERKKGKFTRLHEVKEEFKENEILKDRTFKNILDKLRQIQK